MSVWSSATNPVGPAYAKHRSIYRQHQFCSIPKAEETLANDYVLLGSSLSHLVLC